MRRLLLCLMLFSEAILGHGLEVCRHDGEVGTPLGTLYEQTCQPNSAGASSTSVFKLGDAVLVKSAYPTTFQDRNKSKTIFVLQDASMPALGCPPRLFLIDLASRHPRVFSFGIANACNEFHWASWGKKRSVIAIKRNVKFIYQGGKLIPPKKDNDLFLTIKPTMFETPVEKLEPFVHELPVRKTN